MTADPESGLGRRADLQRSHRKTRDRSMVLLLVGTIALLPPFAGIFLIDGVVGAIPFPVVYVFVTWIVLITGAAILSRPLREGDTTISPDETVDPGR